MLLAAITISSRSLSPSHGVLWYSDLLNLSPIHTTSYVARGDGAEAPPPSADYLGDDFCRRLCEFQNIALVCVVLQRGANLGDDCGQSLVLSDHLGDHLLY